MNLSSMGGKLVFPGGVYHATKYAVEALSDAMRFEVKGFGVDVVLIEPGLIHQLRDTAVGSLDDAGDGEGGGPYAKFNAEVAKSTADAYVGPMAKLGGGLDAVARKIETALTAAGRSRVTRSPRRRSWR